MIVLLSGEGPTDLGQCMNAQGRCSNEDFRIGPLTLLLDQLLAARLNISLRTIPDAFQYVSETRLKENEQVRKNDRRKVSFVGKKRGQETGYFHNNAWMLGEEALAIEREQQQPVVAVLFRDCDGNRSSKAGLWGDKWKAILDGFSRAGFSNGVPMLPKPTSEAWLMCAAKKSPYQHCEKFEELPGNLVSPNHPKKMLPTLLDGKTSGEELCMWIEASPIDSEKLAQCMPSFKAFYDRLIQVMEELA